MQHLRDAHKRIAAERDALLEELAALQRSQRAQRCAPVRLLLQAARCLGGMAADARVLSSLVIHTQTPALPWPIRPLLLAGSPAVRPRRDRPVCSQPWSQGDGPGG